MNLTDDNGVGTAGDALGVTSAAVLGDTTVLKLGTMGSGPTSPSSSIGANPYDV